MRYIIIGGGIAGISAAKAIHECDPSGEIIVYTHEFHPRGLYNRKDLARRLATGIAEPETFLLESQDSLVEQGIQFEYMEILRVFPDQNQVLRKHNIRQGYDRLLLATGTIPRLVDAPGLHLLGVHQLYNFQDAMLLETWLPQLREVGAVIVGGGILGLDLAYALREHDVPTTLVVRQAHVGAPLLDQQAAQVIERRLQRDGISLILGQTVSAYLSEDERVLDAVQLDNGNMIPARMALCAVGVSPAIDFLEDSGIVIDEATNAILVGSFMQTNLENVYAAGSCALAGRTIPRNWTMAAEQGRIAGLNMAGQHTHYAPELDGDLDTHIYDLPFAYFGQRTAPAVQVMAEQNGDTNFSQLFIQGERLVDATLLGEAVKTVPTLLEHYQAGTFPHVANSALG